MSKRILFLVAFVMAIAITGLAEWVNTGKMCYELYSDGTAYVAPRYYGYNSSQVNFYTGVVEIPETFIYESKIYKVTGISSDAFAYCSKLTKIVIPASVNYIGGDVFQDCEALEDVVFKDGANPLKLGYKEIKNASTGLSYISGPLFEYAPVKTLYLGRNLDLSVLVYKNKDVFSGAALVNMTVGPKVTLVPALFDGQKNLRNLTFENGVSEIAANAFRGCGIERLQLPESLKIIGESAFASNSNLTTVVFGSGIESCNNGVFNLCKSLKTVSIPDIKSWLKIEFGGNNANGLEYADGLTVGGSLLTDLSITPQMLIENKRILSRAFANCASLKTLTATGVVSVGRDAFRDCKQLKSIQFDESLTNIDIDAFLQCDGLESARFKNSLQTLGSGAFAFCTNLKQIEGFEGLESYPQGLFEECSSLNALPANSSLKKIGYGAFSGCSAIDNLEIAGTVTSIDRQAFAGCGTMALTILPGAEPLNINSDTFNNTLIPSLTLGRDVIGAVFKNQSELRELNFLEGFTTITESAFTGCTGLVSLNIPASMVSIGNEAFKGCTSIRSINFCDGPERLSIGSSWMSFDSLTDLYLGRCLMGSGLFANAKSLTNVSFGPGCTAVGGFWGCTALTNISIPEHVTEIYNSAFAGCTGLTSFTFPVGIPYVANGVLSGCSNISEVVIPAAVTKVEKNAFADCSSLKKVTFERSSENVVVEETSFMNCPIESLYIGSNITARGIKSPFNGSKLVNLEFAEGVTQIGSYMFKDCVSLTSVSLPATLTDINYYAFAGCSGLYLGNMPQSLNYIANNAFAGCMKLGISELPKSITTIGSSAFENCIIKELTIPGETSIGSRAFANCGIDKLTINEGCILSDDSFYGNSNLFSFSGFETTQTTLSLKCDRLNLRVLSRENGKEIPNMVIVEYDKGAEVKPGKTATIKNLLPETKYNVYLQPGFLLTSLSTKSIVLKLNQEGTVFANNFSVRVGISSLGDAELESAVLQMNKQKWNVADNDLINIDVPAEMSDHTVYPQLQVRASGKLFSTSIPVEIPAIKWENETAMATSYTSARLMADVNLNTTDGFTGVEWRRNDAPANVKSAEANCPVVNQTLVGSLHGLKDDIYYQFRPYYQVSENARSYGNWTGFYTGDAMVFFEPEVVTMKYVLEPGSVTFEGLALAGSDNIIKQGFEYRRIDRYTSRAENEWIQIEASGILMHAHVSDLLPEQEYEFRSFVTTSASTYYGETVSFETPADETGVSEVVSENTDKYIIKLKDNPVIDSPVIFVRSESAYNHIRIFTIDGREVYSTDIVSGEWINLDVYLASGHYIIYVTDGICQDAVHMIVK